MALSSLRFPEFWWGLGGNDLYVPEHSLAELLRQKVMSADVAALLWALLSRRASLLVTGGYQSGAGKTTTLTALTACLPGDVEQLVFTSGRMEDFEWTKEVPPDHAYVLVNEFSDHTRNYLWGPNAARVFALAQEGYRFAGTMHAASIDDVVGQFQAPPVSVPGEVLATTLPVVAMQNIFLEGEEIRRRIVSLYWLYATPLGPNGLGIKSLIAWDSREDRWTMFSSPQTWDQLASWANTPTPSFTDEVRRRTGYLEELAASQLSSYDDVRAALLKFS